MANEITVQNIVDFMNTYCPFETKCEWDNCGLLVGDASQKVAKIGFALDITNEAAEFASKNGIDLIISHHPVIFKPVRSVAKGNPVYTMISNNISAICAHTCLDKASGGVNDALAAKLGFKAYPLTDSGDEAMVRIAETEAMSGVELAEYVGRKLNAEIRLADCGKEIRKIAMCGGSGCDFIQNAVDAGCDAFITGDASHRNFLDALASGITLIAAGHFETENPVMSLLAEEIGKKYNIETILIPQCSPVKYIK